MVDVILHVLVIGGLAIFIMIWPVTLALIFGTLGYIISRLGGDDV